MGTIAVTMFVGLTALALIAKVHITDPTTSSCDSRTARRLRDTRRSGR